MKATDLSRLHFQSRLMTTKAKHVVTTIVPVTAIP